MWMGLVKNVRSRARSYMQSVSAGDVPIEKQAASQRCKDGCRPVVLRWGACQMGRGRGWPGTRFRHGDSHALVRPPVGRGILGSILYCSSPRKQDGRSREIAVRDAGLCGQERRRANAITSRTKRTRSCCLKIVYWATPGFR